MVDVCTVLRGDSRGDWYIPLLDNLPLRTKSGCQVLETRRGAGLLGGLSSVDEQSYVDPMLWVLKAHLEIRLREREFGEGEEVKRNANTGLTMILAASR